MLRDFQKHTLNHFDTHYQNSQSCHILCIAPTGGGKSLIFEKLSMTKKYRMLLVVPLIALARQQLARFQELGVQAHYGYLANATWNTLDVWIIAPETLCTPITKSILLQWKPNFLVVDECHCVWEWGKEFRPAFYEIFKLFEENYLGSALRYSLWLSASLPLYYQQHLENFFKKKLIKVGGFLLPSQLRIACKKISWDHRVPALIQWIKEDPLPGIIFVSTRTIAARMKKICNIVEPKAIFYHAGLAKEERMGAERQVRQQEAPLVIATTAFGMGMNYPHLRKVLILQPPLTLLSLVQMMGRVTRNPLIEGYATIFWHEQDLEMFQWATKEKLHTQKEFQRVWDFLHSNECFRQYIAKTFTHDIIPPCGRCFRCYTAHVTHTTQVNREIPEHSF